MKKWIALFLLLALLLAAYVVAGPFIAINSIRAALQTQDSSALAAHVDFPELRGNLKAQVDDYLVRRAGPEAQSNLFGAIAVRVASGLASGAVETMATPAGIGALLQGRSVWNRISGGGVRRHDSYANAPPRDPLEGADYRYETPSRFTATILDEDGEPVVLVLKRKGLRWKLTDIRLPLGATTRR
ncbi:MAG: DUF2939 domain-containing protein [Pseudomonadota bacterium]|nr:DUF2939 domain-containing protein [Pseudomonadota bacterium]